jgi:thioredoxin reductase
VKVYEAGDTIASNVRDWGHVRLFSPWSFNTDQAAKAILKQHGWQEPPGDALSTGGDLYEAYLRPLADTPEMRVVIETNATVQAISREGISKVTTRGRDKALFSLVVQNGSTRIDCASAVIDASGTWQNQNPLGASGLPAVGEAMASSFIAYGIPDVLGGYRATYAGKRVLVIGSGHSAANALLDLVQLADAGSLMQVTWAVRGTNLARVFGGGDADRLPARAKLGSDLESLVEHGRLKLITGFAADRVEIHDAVITVAGRTADCGTKLGPFDRIIVATGQRPDLEMTRELRLDLDSWLECPKALGPSIDPNLHSCGSVPPHGYNELAHPESGYFAVGVKSYGRAPTFLMATGYEQVRSVTAFLAGDLEAANSVQLVLPETGVCSANLVSRSNSEKSDCCGGPTPVGTDACCADDAKAKSAGASGCGCNQQSQSETVKAAALQ